MRGWRISSSSLPFYRTVLPVLWFAQLAFFLALVVMTGGWRDNAGIFVVLPIALGAGSYLLLKHTVWDLADEVWDAGDHLLVMRAGRTARIALRDIARVAASRFIWPARITLALSPSAGAGGKIAFMPRLASSYVPASGLSISKDLVVRAESARKAA